MYIPVSADSMNKKYSYVSDVCNQIIQDNHCKYEMMVFCIVSSCSLFSFKFSVFNFHATLGLYFVSLKVHFFFNKVVALNYIC